jgi:gamma-glutamyltranspeptidase/glutathione hydrolase
MLNNEMTDFDAYPGGPNEVQPNKRPMSSMSPTIVLKDHKPVMTVGSPGGPTIIASVAQTLINKIDYGMSAEAAIEEPRIYTPTYPNIRYEKGIPSETIKELEKLGYKFDDEPEEIGNVQTIDIYDSFYLGAADSSRVGSAAGVDTVKGK